MKIHKSYWVILCLLLIIVVDRVQLYNKKTRNDDLITKNMQNESTYDIDLKRVSDENQKLHNLLDVYKKNNMSLISERRELTNENVTYLNQINQLNELLDHSFKPTSDDRTDIVNKVFFENDVNLKPQVIIYATDYHLQGIKPHLYEYLDDLLCIYYFRSISDLRENMEDLNRLFGPDYTTFVVDGSILIVYQPAFLDQDYMADQTYKIKKALKVMADYFETN